MPDVLERPFTSPETSDSGPALAAIGDRLYIAWVGRGNGHLNVMPSAPLSSGNLAFDSAAKVIVDRGEGEEVDSLNGPA